MSAPGFDLATLERLETQLGEQRVRAVIALFLEHTPERMRRVRQGVSAGDLDDSAEALHSIKSSAAMLGASELGRLAESMERAAREDRPGDVSSGMPALERVVRATVDFLNGRIGEEGP